MQRAVQRDREMYRQADRRAGRQVDVQAGRKKYNSEAERHTVRQRDVQIKEVERDLDR